MPGRALWSEFLYSDLRVRAKYSPAEYTIWSEVRRLIYSARELLDIAEEQVEQQPELIREFLGKLADSPYYPGILAANGGRIFSR